MKETLRILAAVIMEIFFVMPAFAVTNNSINSIYANNADGWQMAGGTTSRTFTITGSAWTLGNNTMQDSTGTFTLPAATDTLVGRTSTDTLQNKTITNSNDTLGGVTMTLGSDAEGDIYYRHSGVLTRLGAGTSSQVLTGGTDPAYGAVALGSMVSGQLPLANGGTAANLTAPGADSLWGWDNTDSSIKFITIGSGLSYTHSTHTLSSTSSFTPMPTTVVTGTTQTASTNNAYASNNAGLVTITMPSSASVGDEVIIMGLGAGGWQLAQNASQLIHFGSTVTTTGTGGYLASTNQYDSVYLKCLVTNTTWVVIGSQGNITVN